MSTADSEAPSPLASVDDLNTSPRALGPCLALLVYLLALYATPLSTAYLYGDEGNYFWVDPAHNGLFELYPYAVHALGRPLGAFLFRLAGIVLSFDYARLPLIRAAQLLLSWSCACLLLRFLLRRGASRRASLLLVAFLWAQPAVQVHQAYITMVAHWLGVLVAFPIVEVLLPGPRPGARLVGRWGTAGRWASVPLLWLVPFFSYQGSAPYVLALLVFVVLAQPAGQLDWPEVRNRALLSMGLFLGVVATYAVVFRLWLHVPGARTYGRAERLFAVLALDDWHGLVQLLHPARYLGPFEFYNYLIPCAPLDSTRGLLTAAAFFGWLALIGTAVGIEATQTTLRAVVRRWALALTLTAMTLLPIAADRFSGRQHVFLSSSAALAFCAAHALTVIGRRLRLRPRLRTAGRALVVAVVAWVALGARAGVDRGLVRPAARQLAYVQHALAAGPDRFVAQVDVVVPRTIDFEGTCEAEPCSGFMQRRIAARVHVAQASYYRLAAALVGRQLGVVRAVDPGSSAPRGVTVVDMDAYYRDLQHRARTATEPEAKRAPAEDPPRRPGPSSSSTSAIARALPR